MRSEVRLLSTTTLLAFTFSLMLFTVPVLSLEPPELVENLNTYAEYTTNEAISYDGKVFFAYDNGKFGDELWVIESAGADPKLVKDINPGIDGSGPDDFVVVDGLLFFRASHPSYGSELWISDGTEGGTKLFKDINPGTSGSSLRNFIVFNGGQSAIFQARPQSGGRKIHVLSNSGVIGTNLSTDFSGPEGAPVGDKIYVGGSDGSVGYELYSIDKNGSVSLRKDIRPGSSQSSSSPANFLSVAGGVIFSATDGTSGTEPYFASDSDFHQIADISSSGSSAPRYFTELSSGEVAFSAYDDTNGRELWKTDLSMGNATLIKDINPGSESSDPHHLTFFNGMIYFGATNPTFGDEAWASDGTPSGTIMIEDINPGPLDADPYDFYPVGSFLYFVADSSDYGFELYSTKGIGSDINLVGNELRPGPPSSFPYNLITNGVNLYTIAEGESSQSLFQIDSNGTDIEREIPLLGLGDRSSEPSQFAAISETKAFYRYDHPDFGEEPFVLDALTGESTLLKDIYPGFDGSNPFVIGMLNNKVIFSAQTPLQGTELWITDGTEAGTALLKELTPGEDSGYFGRFFLNTLDEYFIFNGELYFQASDDAHGTELWKTDGTTVGTVLVKDIYPGTDSSSPLSAVLGDSAIYFTAEHPTYGREVWKSNGTGGGTVLLKDVRSGTLDGASSSLSYIDGLLLFSATQTTSEGAELWKSDGTTAGTLFVKDIFPGAGNDSSPSNFISFNNAIYFTAKIADTERALHKISAPYAATDIELIKTPDTTGLGTISNMRVLGDTLIFLADSAAGRELWKSDGTTVGTTLLADINPGPDNGATAGNFPILNGTLMFPAYTPALGAELWTTDGSSAQLVEDLFPGERSSDPHYIGSLFGSAYFAAESTDIGEELWRVIYDNCPRDISKLEPGVCGCGIADTDSDGDGTADCNDECSADAFKATAGLCGCGIAETDSDGDGTPDCADQCSADSLKATAGACGCGMPDEDLDSSGVADCLISEELQTRSDLLTKLLTEFKKKPKKGRKARLKAVFQAYKELNRYSRTQLEAFVNSTAKKTKKRLKLLGRKVKKFRKKATNKNKKKALKALARLLTIAP